MHVLPVEVPGGWRVRVGVEQAARQRGWRLASGPADADALVICGSPDRSWDEVLERLWGHLPGPRARGTFTRTDEVSDGLDRLAEDLQDRDRQMRDAVDRAADPAPVTDERTDGHPHGDDTDMNSDMDPGDMDPGAMDMGDMDMAPSGIPLATGGSDRDGLEMDEVHVPLGPCLRHWPPGLVVRCVLHGDLVVDAQVELMAGATEGWDGAVNPAEGAAGWCDAAASTLRLAGAQLAADRAVRVRDALLDPARAGQPGTAALLVRLAADVRGSRLLRWSLGGLGVRPGVGPTGVDGDVFARLCAQFDAAAAALSGGSAPPVDAGRAAAAALPELLTGNDLAAARLVVASTWPPAVARTVPGDA
ncbi:hypothetical protein GCM10009818_11100 [Nakamurella flavida]